MRKILSILMVALLVAIPLEAATKKKAAPRKKSTSTSAAITKGETETYGDYLTTQTFTYKKGDNEIKVEYPISGNPELVSAMRTWIKDVVNRDFRGSLTTPDALLKSAMSNISRGENVQNEIEVEYANGKIVTLVADYYWYGGGAHGSAAKPGATFRVSDGEKFDEDMLPSFSKLIEDIRVGLANYAKCSPSEVDGWLFSPLSNMEYPSSIYIDDDGIVFQYGEYEIAPWSEGLPKAVVPVDNRILQSLTSEGKTFF